MLNSEHFETLNSQLRWSGNRAAIRRSMMWGAGEGQHAERRGKEEVKNLVQREKVAGKRKKRKEAIKVKQEDKTSYYFMSLESLLEPFFLLQPRLEDPETEDRRRFQFQTCGCTCLHKLAAWALAPYSHLQQ
jgi:hypothetical protein